MEKIMKAKVLISSILTIMLCLGVLAGSTLAFATSESEQSYAITSGKVDVVAGLDDVRLFSAQPDKNGDIEDENGAKYSYVEQYDGYFSNGGLAFVKDNAMTVSKMSTGDKVQATISIVNNSNIDIFYRAVMRIEADNGLLEGLVFEIGGKGLYAGVDLYSAWTPLEPGSENIELPVTIELPITAGNEFQNKLTRVSFVVEAVVGNANTDNSLLFTEGEHIVEEVILVNDKDVLSSVVAAGNSNVTITDGFYDGGMGDGHTSVTAQDNAKVEIKDGYFTVGTDENGNPETVIYAKGNSEVTITGGFFEGLGGSATDLLDTEDGSNASIVVKGGTYVNYDPTEFVPNGYTVEVEQKANGDIWYVVVAQVDSFEALKQAFADGTDIVLVEDVELSETLIVESGDSVTLDLNGYKLSISDNSSVDPMFIVKEGGSFTVNGDGTVDLGNNHMASLIFPYGDVTINGGNYIREYDPNISVWDYGSMFYGINRGQGKLVINGGYFDSGCYAEGDCYNNSYCLLNLSNEQYVRVFGGTFVAQNPAWGDEGFGHVCCPDSKSCQGTFLEGQVWTDTEIPAAYTIVEGVTEDGRPTYTVNYTP